MKSPATITVRPSAASAATRSVSSSKTSDCHPAPSGESTSLTGLTTEATTEASGDGEPGDGDGEPGDGDGEPGDGDGEPGDGDGEPGDGDGEPGDGDPDGGIKFDGKNLKVGRKLEFDGKAERFVNDKEADALLTRNYRKGFVVPDKVA